LILMNVGNAYPGLWIRIRLGLPPNQHGPCGKRKANPCSLIMWRKAFARGEHVSCCYGHSLVEMCDLESDTGGGVMNTFASISSGSRESVSPIISPPFSFLRIMPRFWRGGLDERGRAAVFTSSLPHLGRGVQAFGLRLPSGPEKVAGGCRPKARVHLYEKLEDFQILVVAEWREKRAYAGVFPANPHVIKS